MPKKINSSNILYLGIGLVILIALAAALIVGSDKPKPKPKPEVASSTYNSACGPYRNDLTVNANHQAFKTEFTKTQQEREKGLGGRPCILDDQAMLFAYAKAGTIPIWMKDMKFPIDIVWLGTDRKVVGIEINVLPSTYPDRFINKDHPAQYVLELKANRAKELNLDLGTPVNL